MKHRLLQPAVLLAAAVLGSACGSGEIGAGGNQSDTFNGDARTASPVDPADVNPDYGLDAGVSSDVPVSVPPPGIEDESGRPWAHNTGPSDPGALVPYQGRLSITTDGAVYENLDISGDVRIEASNVTLRNFRIDGSFSTIYGVKIASGHSGIVMEDGEIFNTGNGIKGLGYTARRLHIHDNTSDALRPEDVPGSGPTLVEYCFVEKMGLSEDAHADALQVSGVSDGSYDMTLQYNNFYMPVPGSPGHPGDASKASSVIFFAKPVSNYVIQNNWLDGGGYTIYCGPATSDVLWRNNIFGTNYNYDVVTGTCQNWSGNVWESTGDPVAPN